IRQRLAKLDWQKMKKQAIEHYWHTYAPPTLPTATAPKMFHVDTSIVMARTIRAPGGDIIARKGQRINPLATVPFTGALIAFKGDNKTQVQLARQLAKTARREGLRPIMLTQGLPG